MKTLTVLSLSLMLLLTGCGGASTDARGKTTQQSADDIEASSQPQPGAQPQPEPEVAPVLLGTQRYVSPCRLLPPDTVQRIYGDAGKYAHITQQIVERTIPTAQMREIAKTIGGSVHTQCRYTFDDKAQTAINLQVDQYISPQAAMRQWRRIRKLGTGRESRQLEREGTRLEFLIEWAKENEANAGGDPVKGLDPSVLYVAGKADFVGVRGNLLIRVGRQNYAGQAFTGKGVKGPLHTARAVFREIYQRADDTSLEQAPIDSWWEQQDGWPEFLQACAILDEDAMLRTTGHPSIEVEDSSVLRDPNTRLLRNTTPEGRAVSNECRRMGKQARANSPISRFWNASGEIAYAAPGDTGATLLQGFVLRRLFGPTPKKKVRFGALLKAKVLRPTTVKGADRAYLFDYKRPGTHYGWLVAAVGDYVVRLDATRSTKGFDMAPMPVANLVAGTEAMVANIKAATED